MTSAPRSDRSAPHQGPAMTRERSITRTPSSARGKGVMARMIPRPGSDLRGEEGRLVHLSPDGGHSPPIRRRVHSRMPRARHGQARGEGGRLRGTELRGGAAEVALARGARAEHAGAELRDIQIELEDPSLGERALELPGEDRLLDLPIRAACSGEPQVLGELLGDGGGAARGLAFAHRFLQGALYLAQIEAAMGEEVDVLRHEHGPLEVRGDRRVGHPGPRDAVGLAVRPLPRAVVVDEGRAGGALGGQARHVRPRGQLPGDPRGGREEEDEEETAPPPRAWLAPGPHFLYVLPERGPCPIPKGEPMSPVDPNEPMLTGENSFIRLSPDGGKTMSDRASHWRVLWCGAG